eukprot:10741278-Lingulodinium_polyedra.AAC.1
MLCYPISRSAGPKGLRASGSASVCIGKRAPSAGLCRRAVQHEGWMFHLNSHGATSVNSKRVTEWVMKP